MSTARAKVAPTPRSERALTLNDVRPVRRVYRFGNFVFCDVPLRLQREGTNVGVRPQSLRVLARLLATIGDLVSADELQEIISSPGQLKTVGQVRVAVTHLRRALEDGEEKYIETIRGQGYRFVQPVEVEEQPLLKSRRRAELSRSRR